MTVERTPGDVRDHHVQAHGRWSEGVSAVLGRLGAVSATGPDIPQPSTPTAATPDSARSYRYPARCVAIAAGLRDRHDRTAPFGP